MAIAVGVFAFGGVFISRTVLLADMSSAYRAIHPASITVSLSSFDDGLVSAVKHASHVADAEGRGVMSVQALGPSGKLNLDMYAVGDFTRIAVNQIEPETGDYPPRLRQIVLERKSAQVMGVGVGDTITVELADGTTHDLTVSGIVHDLNAVPATLFPQLTGYATLDTLRWLGHPGTYNLLYVVTDPTITTQEQAGAVADDIRKRIERSGYYVGSTQATKPGEHWAADTTRTFTTVLSGIGLFSLILSGFLVLNTISAVLTQQKRQIGMMKSVGGTAPQIVGVYLTMVAVFGLLSLLIALPVGMGLGYLSTVAVAQFLNINILDFHLPLWVLALELAVSLVVPVVAALLPVLNGTRVTVREAVSDYGIGQRAGHRSLIDALLARVRGLPRPTLLSLRNTFRRKGRLVLTLLTLTLAGAIFIAVINVRGSLMLELDNILKVFNFDIQIALDNAYQVPRLEREALRVPGVVSAESWAFAQPRTVHADGTLGSTFTLFGPPPETPFVIPTMLEGRWLQPGDKNAIVMGSQLMRDEPDIHVGDTITLDINGSRREWVVVGVLSLPGQVAAYAPFDYLSRLQGMAGLSGAVFVGTAQHTGAYQTQVSGDLEERFKRAGIGVSQTLTTDTIIGANVSQFNFLIAFMLVMAVFLAVVGGLGLAGTMSLNVLERTREIGVMRSVGATNGSVRGVVMTEGILIGLISWALGTLIAIPMSYGFAAAVGMAFFERPMVFTFSPLGVIIWLAVVVVIAAIASALPARRAARISVREALAYE